jgi:hypothetical protein
MYLLVEKYLHPRAATAPLVSTTGVPAMISVVVVEVIIDVTALFECAMVRPAVTTLFTTARL